MQCCLNPHPPPAFPTTQIRNLVSDPIKKDILTLQTDIFSNLIGNFFRQPLLNRHLPLDLAPWGLASAYAGRET